VIVDVDIVIPTLGGPTLFQTISHLNDGYFKPKNIICVTYKKELNNIKLNSNIKIIKSYYKNQVHQRNLGFKYVKSKYVMQMDDDVFFEKDTLKKLFLAIQNKTEKNVIGPIYILEKKNLNKIKIFNFVKNIYHYLICASKWGDHKYGKITKLTISFTVNSNFKQKKLIETEWLPGGCIIFNKKLLYINNIKYPFKGKSFCEDIFHSFQRKKRNIKHHVLTDAFANHKTASDLSIKSFLMEMRVRNTLLKKNIFIKLRFFIWASFEMMIRLIKKFNYLLFIKNKI
jgi:GT2 family glycosyltransferase